MNTDGRLFLALAFATALGCLNGALAAGPCGYHLVRELPISGGTRWDYLTADGPARRLYVGHGDRVQVLDLDTLEPVGIVAAESPVHGILPLDHLGKGFICSGKPGSVVVFDLKTLKRLALIPSRPDTDGIAYDPVTGRVFTFDGDSREATVLDPETDAVVKILPLGGAPEAGATDGQGDVFDNLESTGEVVRINARTLRITERWSVAPGKSPSGMAMDRAHHRLFIGCRNKLLVVMDARSGRVVQTLPIGGHVDTTYFDPATGTVFNSCGDGTLSVVHEDSPNRYHVVENAGTEWGARTMAFDPETGRVFLSTARFYPAPAGAKHRREGVPGTFHVLVMGKCRPISKAAGTKPGS